MPEQWMAGPGGGLVTEPPRAESEGPQPPPERLRVALQALYGRYERTGEPAPESELATLRSTLARGLREDQRTAALLAHALEFATWRSLTTNGLTSADAADAMARLAASAAPAAG